jgi:hypothetical protein
VDAEIVNTLISVLYSDGLILDTTFVPSDDPDKTIIEIRFARLHDTKNVRIEVSKKDFVNWGRDRAEKMYDLILRATGRPTSQEQDAQ